LKCYAVYLGNCSGKLSREHYISKSALELAGKTVSVSGFPWQTPDQSMEIGIESLTSKILCEHHNSELSPLDVVGSDFLRLLKASIEGVASDGEFKNETVHIDGLKLEAWLLKVLCGTIALSGRSKVPEEWVNILFQNRPFPKDSGLYFFGAPGLVKWNFNLMRMSSVQDKSGKIAGAKFGIGGIATLLAFGKPIFEEAGIDYLYRPSSLVFQKESNAKHFEFSWGSHQGYGSMNVRVTTAHEQDDLSARFIVMPLKNK